MGFVLNGYLPSPTTLLLFTDKTKCLSTSVGFFSLGFSVMSVISSCATLKLPCQNPKPTNYQFERVSVRKSPSQLSPCWPTLGCQNTDNVARMLKLVPINLFDSAGVNQIVYDFCFRGFS